MKILGKIKYSDTFCTKGFLGIFWPKGIIVDGIVINFDMKRGVVYEIEIIEGSKFEIENTASSRFYHIRKMLSRDGKRSRYIGLVCKTEFDKLFFTPDSDKLYDITVTEVKK